MSNLNGSICTPEEQARAIGPTSGIFCLTRGQSIGLAFTAEAGCVSLVAVVGVFLLILRKYIRHVKLIQRPTDLYMLSLFTSDLLQAMGAVLDIKWVHEGKVYVGGYCTAQGVIQQLGETAVAMATLTIAIHTLIVVMWGKLKHQLIVAYIVVACIWLYVIIFVAVTVSIHTRGSSHYETPTPYWCWIGDGTRYDAERIAGEYLWLWITLFVSILAYIPLFFWAQGNITVSTEHWWEITFHSSKENIQGIDPDGRRRRSLGMIAYPLVYSVIVLPLSVVRWITGFGTNTHQMSSVATFIVISIYSLSGALNAMLFLLTRSDLLLLGNTSSVPSKGLGLAPGIALAVGTDRPSGATDADSTRSRIKSRQPPLDVEDEGWQLPTIEHPSEET
ncbi:hypothetical protein PILCRDRAFT_819583 [Piloderma croceum F 1598]|uniref:G-protein coupled receptors family 1 profile domain-containing protein n=1 Tax=Piloderma croceum (strain F 1598) TaxID=765440 RepID=A0A0C3FFZ8_PILCF|nr:hypothetical protein PILCRDRAFT_819583 [Piloderma croceum F 1598]